MTNQLSIFELIQQTSRMEAIPAGSLNFRSELCAAMSADIKHAHDEQGRELSRYDVAARMSNLLHREIAKSTLDNWTAPSHDAHTPDAVEIAAFSRATCGRRAMEVIARHAGLFAVPGPEAIRAQMQRRNEQRTEITDELKRLRILLSEVERGR